MELLIVPAEEPEKINGYYDQIARVYQQAFAGPPWYEVSNCADEQGRCVGGFSKQPIGANCGTCENKLTETAYPTDELITRFKAIAASRPTAWYLEQDQEKLAMAALAWVAPAGQIFAEKYSDVPEMEQWLTKTVGEKPIVWLDEVFADNTVRDKGNLRNFLPMNQTFMSRLGVETIAYRTITPQMVFAGQKAGFRIFDRQGKRDSQLPLAAAAVPDRRDFLVRTKSGGEM